MSFTDTDIENFWKNCKEFDTSLVGTKAKLVETRSTPSDLQPSVSGWWKTAFGVYVPDRIGYMQWKVSGAVLYSHGRIICFPYVENIIYNEKTYREKYAVKLYTSTFCKWVHKDSYTRERDDLFKNLLEGKTPSEAQGSSVSGYWRGPYNILISDNKYFIEDSLLSETEFKKQCVKVPDTEEWVYTSYLPSKEMEHLKNLLISKDK